MNTTLHSSTIGHDPGHDVSSVHGKGPMSVDIAWAERAFASPGPERRNSHSARPQSSRRGRRRMVLVLCTCVLIFVGLVVSAASLSPGTAPVPAHHSVTAVRPAVPEPTPSRSIHLGPLPFFERGATTAFNLTPLDWPLLVQPDRPGPSTSR